MATDKQAANRQPDQTDKGVKGMAFDNKPTGFRKFKSTVPANYKSPTPVRVPPPPTSNKGS
jgi:hypothetical protein